MRKKYKKNKKNNPNQKSFYFEDYLEINHKKVGEKNKIISEDRIYLLFFLFLSLILIFAIKITMISIQKPNISIFKTNTTFLPIRRDILDRNGELISRNIQMHHAAVRSSLVKDKERFAIKAKLIFPNLDLKKIKENLDKKKYFYLKKRMTDEEKEKIWALGEKAIVFEPFQSRIYPHAELYSHVLGQIDNDNYGISGIENFFDRELKKKQNLKKPLYLSLDTNIQYIVKDELKSALKTFKAIGAAGLLMDAQNGEVLSLVSLPDFNINKREAITKHEFTNKITKSVFELGSIFKTFTIALALEKNLYEPSSIIKNIPNKIKCSIYEISDVKIFPKNLSVEDILIRSSNIGTLMIAREIGENNFKIFLNKLNLLNRPNLEINEVGTPLKFRWDKCKLETVSYGHGITTTPLQAAAAYASLINDGYLISPTLIKNKNTEKKNRIISSQTSKEMRKILRKVVTDKEGTASLANIFGYKVSGKTGTSEYYKSEKKNINTFISFFYINQKKYVLLVMLDNPQVATDLVYNYRGVQVKGSRNEAGWNSVYTSGKIIKKIGPILAINSKEFDNNYVVKKPN